MSRDFEEEYKKFSQKDLPDLWSRIEEEISKTDGKEAEIEATAESSVKMIHSDKRKKKKKPVIWISTLTACACLLLLVIPVMLSGRNKNSETMASKEMAAPAESAESAESEETAPQTEESYALTAADTSTEQSEDADIAQSEDTDTAQAKTGDEMAGEAVESKMEAENADITGIAYTNVMVTVTAVENTGEEVIFETQVIRADASDLEAGRILYLCISENEFPELAEGQTYTVDVKDPSPELSDNHPYIITAIK